MPEEFGFVPLDTSSLQLELDFSSFLPPDVLASLQTDTPPDTTTPDTTTTDPTTDTGGTTGGAPLDPPLDPAVSGPDPTDPVDPTDTSGGSGGAPLAFDAGDVVPATFFGADIFAL